MKLLFVLAVVSVLLFVSIGESYAQKYDAVLVLNSIPSQMQSGNTVIFSGQLTTSDGQYAIPHRTVYIKDDVDFGTDIIIGSVETNDSGQFSASWIATPRSKGSYDLYAVFEGDDSVQKARSKTWSVFVYEGSSSDSEPSNSYGNSGSSSSSNQEEYRNYFETRISLNPIQSSIFAGESITFTGTLTSNGNPIPNAFIKIMEDDPLSSDQLLSSGRTNSNGVFSILWQATKGYLETDFDVYAVFEGDSNFLRSRSPDQTLSVLRHAGSITLDPIPKSANIGDVVTFSGTLELNQGSPEGAIMYIKDEDPLSGDDLLATAYVDRYGGFSASWFARDVDPDGVADIYAVFEGNDVFYRLTTCNPNPTMDYGGSCKYTIPLSIHYTKPKPIQPNLGTSNNGYMKLLYSLDFTKNPHVAIVPNPDSYDDAKRYIIPAEEGIQMWQTHLDNKYGGNWNVDFEIITPDKIFFKNKPDVIMNLVTPEQKSGCDTDYYGIAYTTGIKPVQAYVCVISDGQKRDPAGVSATAAHEFIHTMGLGHAFNQDLDLMCSIENNVETCNYHNKAKTPSNLNLVGVSKLYGTDGYKNPNSKVTYGSKVSIGGSIETTTENPTSGTVIPTDTDGDGIPDYRDECTTKPEIYNDYFDSDGCPDERPKSTQTTKNKPEIITHNNDYQTIPVIVKKYETSTQKFSGLIPKDLIVKGVSAEITIIKPDNRKEILKLTVTKDGYFEYPFIFDDKFQQGKYRVSLSYGGFEIKKIAYDVGIKNKDEKAKTENSEKTKPKNLVKEGDYVTLSGMGIDPYADTVQWKQIGGEPVELSSTTVAEPVFTAPCAEIGKTKTLSFQVTVTDRSGMSNTDTIEITVLPRTGCTIVNSDLEEPVAPSNGLSRTQIKEITQKLHYLNAVADSLDLEMKNQYKSIRNAEDLYSDSKSKEYVKKAMTLHGSLYQKLDDTKGKITKIEEMFDYSTAKKNSSTIKDDIYNTIIDLIDEVDSTTNKIGSDMHYISQELDFAKKSHEKTKQDTATSMTKQCFLFWC